MLIEDTILNTLAQSISDEIDKEILTMLQATRIVQQEATEKALRDEYPTLMEAWEEYQVKLRLIQAGQLSR